MTTLYMHRIAPDKSNLECPVCHEKKLDIGTCEPWPGEIGNFDMQPWEASCTGCNALGSGDTEAEAVANIAPQK